MQVEAETFDSWAVVELMGHCRMAGRLTEEQRFGGKIGRLDVPNGDGFTTVYFTANSIFRITPTTEALARVVAVNNAPEPVHLYELRQLKSLNVQHDADLTNEAVGEIYSDEDARDYS